ncbi:MAG: hypothetical protein ACR2O1_10105, partial [Boseongicola sp.]
PRPGSGEKYREGSPYHPALGRRRRTAVAAPEPRAERTRERTLGADGSALRPTIRQIARLERKRPGDVNGALNC